VLHAKPVTSVTIKPNRTLEVLGIRKMIEEGVPA
jgi:hypothetical protein